MYGRKEQVQMFLNLKENMALEKKFNEYGQEQIIDNFDKIVKIGDKFLQVRLIKTKKWKDRNLKKGEFTEPMPRARFIDPSKHFYYLVNKEDLMKIKEVKK